MPAPHAPHTAEHSHDAHDAHQRHAHHDAAALAETLALDAALAGSYLDDAVRMIAAEYDRAPQTIVDLGAGTGAGTLALARAFPEAEVIAVDASPTMLEHVTRGAHDERLASRVRTVECDLNEKWPDAVAGADLVWASSSLHELRHPERVLRDAYAALRPSGLIAVLEMDVLPSFLPANYPSERPGLEERLRAALASLGWNPHHDWEPVLGEVGFDLRERARLTSEASGANVVTYARSWLSKVAFALIGRPDAGRPEQTGFAEQTELAEQTGAAERTGASEQAGAAKQVRRVDARQEPLAGGIDLPQEASIEEVDAREAAPTGPFDARDAAPAEPLDPLDATALEALLSNEGELECVATTVRGVRTALLARRPATDGPAPTTP